MASEITFKGVKLLVKEGDLTEEKADAIVNPANTKGLMAGGLSLAIKQKGGEQIEKDATAAAPTLKWNAYATTAGKLAARKVIHAPTVQEPGWKSEARIIDRATRGALGVAKDISARTISFPGLGCGTGGVPKVEAAQTMISATRYFLAENEGHHSIREIRFVAFDEELEKAFDTALATLEVKPAAPAAPAVEAAGEPSEPEEAAEEPPTAPAGE